MNKITFYAARSLTASLILIAALAPSGVYAHGGATGIVKERMDAMSAMADAMEVMGDMVKGKRPLKREAFVDGSNVVAEHSAEITGLFPEGSSGGKSDALSKLWQQWGQFEAMAKRTQNEADKLGELSGNSGDNRSLKVQFIKLGKSCKSCHTDYRKKKKEKH